MKRITALLLTLLLLFSMSETALAAENENDEYIDVYAKYERDVTYVVDGKAEFAFGDITVKILDIPDEAETILVVYTTEENADALSWFEDVMTDAEIEGDFYPFSFIIMSDTGEEIPNCDVSVTITVPEGIDDPVVYSVSSDGTKELIESSAQDDEITFAAGDSQHYVIADKKASAAITDPDDPNDPNAPDDLVPEPQIDNDGFPWWIIPVGIIPLGCGGFAIYWFVIKKKTWADLIALFKKKEENEE